MIEIFENAPEKERQIFVVGTSALALLREQALKTKHSEIPSRPKSTNFLAPIFSLKLEDNHF